ncbi:MAG: glycosyltransferase family 2 protein [Paludibacteraceae bacterium]|nr:glycosyltransferase family 2 protein [Paludibacteraceae bacterium]
MVDIVMATYNGAQYIDEQIRSFCRQTYSDWRCIAHDDGSTDGTRDILRAWAKREKRIVFIEDGVCGLGPARHFIHILQYSDAPWIMWSDQDDVWFDNKVETMLKAAEKAAFKGAGVVYSNAELWNPAKGVISHRNTLFYPACLREMLFHNSGIQGASSLFNSAMCDILRVPLSAYAMHDHLMLLVALCFGTVIYLDEPLMYYRQHDHNVSGNAPGSKWRKVQLMWRNRHEPVIFNPHYEGTKAFYEHYKAQLKNSDRHILEVYLLLPYCNWFKRFQIIRREHFTLFGSRWILLLKLYLRRYKR